MNFCLSPVFGLLWKMYNNFLIVVAFDGRALQGVEGTLAS